MKENILGERSISRPGKCFSADQVGPHSPNCPAQEVPGYRWPRWTN